MPFFFWAVNSEVFQGIQLLDVITYAVEIDIAISGIAQLAGDHPFGGDHGDQGILGAEELYGSLKVAIPTEQDNLIILIDGIEHVNHDLDVQVCLLGIAT